ncbi:MAG: hypothetical protein GF387_00775 [Candidatus Portnoybacteria bacterium]|nr:hypothetical protein [Candidatus Portnoybacteria bacterium]
MKTKIFLVFFLSIFFALGFSDDVQLNNIQVPGGESNSKMVGILLGENIIGPCKVLFSGRAPGTNIPVLSREETVSSGGTGSFDRLETLYSGKIYSEDLSEPLMFENKTPEELIQMEIPIFPKFLQKPYNLFLDLEIHAKSDSKESDISDDAGTYLANLTTTIIKL